MNIDELVINQIIDAVTVFQPTGRAVRLENRKSSALSFSLGGKITYTHNGKEYVSDTEHVLFHPQNSAYDLHCNKGGRFFVIDFFTDENYNEFGEVSIKGSQTVVDLLAKLEDAFLLGYPKSEKMSIFYAILSRLIPKQNDDNALTFARRIIENEYANVNLSISKLAQNCNMSQSYFRRKFAQTYNVSPKKFLCDVRIEKAKRLLVSWDKNVSEIAEQCGFSSVYHFSRAFKLSVGETPKEFAKKQRL